MNKNSTKVWHRKSPMKLIFSGALFFFFWSSLSFLTHYKYIQCEWKSCGGRSNSYRGELGKGTLKWKLKKEQRGIYPRAIVFVMLILLNAYCCGAAVFVKSSTTVCCNGRLDECLIEDDLDLELLMNPYISRMLKGPSSHPGVNAVNNRNSRACENSICSEGCKKCNSFDCSCQ